MNFCKNAEFFVIFCKKFKELQGKIQKIHALNFIVMNFAKIKNQKFQNSKKNSKKAKQKRL